jgi:DNA-binding PadR family transcriptional regulator
MPENALKETIRQLSSEDISKDEIQIEINWLEAKGYIDFTKGPLGDPEKRWFITEAGKANLH